MSILTITDEHLIPESRAGKRVIEAEEEIWQLRVHVLHESQTMVVVGFELNADDYWSVHSVSELMEELIGVYGCGIAHMPDSETSDVAVKIPRKEIEENPMRHTQKRIREHEDFDSGLNSPTEESEDK